MPFVPLGSFPPFFESLALAIQVFWHNRHFWEFWWRKLTAHEKRQFSAYNGIGRDRPVRPYSPSNPVGVANSPCIRIIQPPDHVFVSANRWFIR